ncbi:MAG TPA: hypothetical protein VFQ54_12555, partial [Thermomicrobiales bacterium]|nr:hypothetical protein [Thermomicrobiales bacterium]
MGYDPIDFVDQPNPLNGDSAAPKLNAENLAHMQTQYASAMTDSGTATAAAIAAQHEADNAAYGSGIGRFDIRNYGAKVDGIELTDCAMTSGSAVLDSVSFTFTADDIGKVVGVGGAGYQSPDYSTNGNDGKLISTIVSVSNGLATLADAAVNTVSGAVVAFGTPDDAAIAAAHAAATAAGGGTVFFPVGRTIVTTPIVINNFVSWAGVHRDSSWVEVIFSAPGTGPAVAGTTDWLSCAGRTASNPLTGVNVHDFGVEDRFHIRPGGYTAPLKPINIYETKRCSIYNM